MKGSGFNGTKSLDSVEPQGGLKKDITVYLAKIGFVDRVMTDVLELPGKTRKILLWAGFCLFNIFLLVVFGINLSFLAGVAGFLQENLGQFFFLFLGITLFGGLIGLVSVSDISFLKAYLPKTDSDKE